MSEAKWLTKAEQSAWRSWIAVATKLPEALSKDLETQHGLTLTDYEILAHLSESPNRQLRMSELAKATLASRSKLSHQITRLETLGLVERRTCNVDGRGQFAQLTPKGFRKIQAAAKDHVASVRKHLVDVLGKDFIEFGKLTQIIAENLNEIEVGESTIK
jgi:DNA-binding MarR family transcriptional regulator